jgi:hypothetical protein
MRTECSSFSFLSLSPLSLSHTHSHTNTHYLTRTMHAVLADREDSNTELALLVADFVMLDEQLTALSEALLGNANGGEKGGANNAKSEISGGAGGAHGERAFRSMPLGIVGEEVLEKLAVEIPDMRVRVGVM